MKQKSVQGDGNWSGTYCQKHKHENASHKDIYTFEHTKANMSAYSTEQACLGFFFNSEFLRIQIIWKCNKDIFPLSCIDITVHLYSLKAAGAEMLKLATSHTVSGIIEYNLQLSNLKTMQLHLYDAISKLYACWEMLCLRCNVAFLLGRVHHTELPHADTGAWSALFSGLQWSAVRWKHALWSPLLIDKKSAFSDSLKKNVFIECATEKSVW